MARKPAHRTKSTRDENSQVKGKLTHRLECDPATHRWSCKCGYKLGDGHNKLYARCKLLGTVQVNTASVENNVSLPRRRKVSRAALDLFEM
jgi:hypothetical protein